MIENSTLAELFQEYEKIKTGYLSRDFSGNILLQTELTWLNKFLSEKFENVYDLNHISQISLSELNPSQWENFCSYTYRLIGENKNDLGKIIKRVLSFLKWLNEKGVYLNSEIEIHISSLKFQYKTIERYLKIFKHFSQIVNSRIYIADPTEDINNLELNTFAYESQLPHISSKYEDQFKVISLDKSKQLAYLNSVNEPNAIVLKVDSYLLKLFSVGDIYPITIGSAENNESYLLDYTYPLIAE
jgi:hypothetical protein